jgi:hypothetical protein
MRTSTRVRLAVVLAAILVGLQTWGWGDAVPTLAAGARWLWRAAWPVIWLVVLPLVAAGALYVATGRASLRRSHRALQRTAGQSRQAWLLAILAGSIVLLGVALVIAPGWLVARDTATRSLTAEQHAKAISDARSALLQAVGGLLLAAGAVATWRQVRISREGQITERFTRAVDQLGSEDLDVRLGGLFALERIARDSPDDRPTIAEILTAYIRQRSPWPPSQKGQYRPDWPLEQQPDLRARAPDVQAALTVLGRGRFPKPSDPAASDADRLDLREIDLRRADLNGVHLQGARLDGARLQGTWLLDAHLEGAVLTNAHLEGAVLGAAYLKGAVLVNAHLENTVLGATDWDATLLNSRDLDGATRKACADLEGAVLTGAHLKGAWLEGVNLRGAALDGAHLEGARCSPDTVWPDRFSWEAAGVIYDTTAVSRTYEPT